MHLFKYMKKINLSKINPEFRNLTDLLFFSNSAKLDINRYKLLFDENQIQNKEYILNTFEASSNIFLIDNSIWFSRMEVLHFVNKNIFKKISKIIKKSFYSILNSGVIISNNNIKYTQFIELIKFKHKIKSSLIDLKEYLLSMCHHVSNDNLVKITNDLTPFVFSGVDEYINLISKKIKVSVSNFDFLKSLENNGFILNESAFIKTLINAFDDLLLNNLTSLKYKSAIFCMILDKNILSHIKQNYSDIYKENIVKLIKSSDYYEIEGERFDIMEKLLDIDESLTDIIIRRYVIKLYQRYSYHKKANVDKLIKLLNKFKFISCKKILLLLIEIDQSEDIKYILKEFPELKNLASFI